MLVHIVTQLLLTQKHIYIYIGIHILRYSVDRDHTYIQYLISSFPRFFLSSKQRSTGCLKPVQKLFSTQVKVIF